LCFFAAIRPPLRRFNSGNFFSSIQIGFAQFTPDMKNYTFYIASENEGKVREIKQYIQEINHILSNNH
jgi:hypothetical protein